MKIQCDVCSKDEATVFCCADDAALCTACDRRVHGANKLAGKHRRFSLHLPSSDAASAAQPYPLCDICQEKRGFMFCKEDRAILCKDCDAPIHEANHLTMKHSRFLLTGAYLSSTPISVSSPVPEQEKPELSDGTTTTESVICNSGASAATNNNSSSISEYLIKTLPGWRVEDLLVDDAAAVAAIAAADASYKVCNQTNELLPFLEVDMDGGYPGGTSEFPIWFPRVPEIPLPHLPSATFSGTAPDHTQRFIPKDVSSHAYHRNDDALTVPQISPISDNNKRPRPSLWYY